MPVTLGKSLFAFVECNIRRTPLDKAPDDKCDFAECQSSGTRQNLLPSASALDKAVTWGVRGDEVYDIL